MMRLGFNTTTVKVKYKALLIFIAVLLLGNAHAANKVGSIAAAADGKGSIRIIWTVKPQYWPAGGWRIQNDKGTILITKLKPGYANALKMLSKEDKKQIARLTQLHTIRDVKRRKQIVALASWHAITDWDFAQAVGLATELHWLGAGKHRYKVIALNAKGKPTHIKLETRPINAHVATPLPKSPRHFHAKQRENTVALYWSPISSQRREKVYTYAVTRSSQTESGSMLNKQGEIFNFKQKKSKKKKSPVFVDWQPPVEQQVIYQVYSVDIFGRRSEPVTTNLFVTDYDALRPPDDLTAKANKGKVTLKWKRIANKHTKGIFIARAFLHQGPYEFMQAKPLPADSTHFVDEAVQGGTDYYYRVYSMNTRGDVGPPSDPVAAQPRGLKPPLTPKKLIAHVGMTRVRLNWQAVSCAGYIIERRDVTEKHWSRLNERLTPEPRYDDHIGIGNGGEYEYRIFAVAQDNQQSEASDIIKVQLLDSVPPSPPHITGARGVKGHVELTFKPSEPQRDSHHFFVLRAGSADEPGLVLGDALSGRKRQYNDDWVEAGQTYWYRLVAVDTTGNRSQPSDAVQVFVPNPDIPTAQQPSAKYIAKPFREVMLKFRAPPQGLRVLVQASLDGLHWRTVFGPGMGSTAVDSDPPKRGKVRYRVIYQAANGAVGQASQEAIVALP